MNNFILVIDKNVEPGDNTEFCDTALNTSLQTEGALISTHLAHSCSTKDESIQQWHQLTYLPFYEGEYHLIGFSEVQAHCVYNIPLI